MKTAPSVSRPLFEGPDRWLIAFEDVEPSKHWIRRVLGMLAFPRHVYAFRGCTGGTLVLEHLLDRATCGILEGVSEQAHRQAIEARGGIVVEAWPETARTWTPRLGNCVSLTRALLGMSMRAQTARGLYLELCRRRV